MEGWRATPVLKYHLSCFLPGQQGVHTGSIVRSYSANRASPSFGRRLVGSTARVGGHFTLSADIQASPSPATTWYK